jgi:hypothetical protein
MTNTPASPASASLTSIAAFPRVWVRRGENSADVPRPTTPVTRSESADCRHADRERRLSHASISLIRGMNACKRV